MIRSIILSAFETTAEMEHEKAEFLIIHGELMIPFEL